MILALFQLSNRRPLNPKSELQLRRQRLRQPQLSLISQLHQSNTQSQRLSHPHRLLCLQVPQRMNNLLTAQRLLRKVTPNQPHIVTVNHRPRQPLHNSRDLTVLRMVPRRLDNPRPSLTWVVSCRWVEFVIFVS